MLLVNFNLIHPVGCCFTLCVNKLRIWTPIILSMLFCCSIYSIVRSNQSLTTLAVSSLRLLPFPHALRGSPLFFTAPHSQQQALSAHAPAPLASSGTWVHAFILWATCLHQLVARQVCLLSRVLHQHVISPCWEGKRKEDRLP